MLSWNHFRLENYIAFQDTAWVDLFVINLLERPRGGGNWHIGFGMFGDEETRIGKEGEVKKRCA